MHQFVKQMIYLQHTEYSWRPIMGKFIGFPTFWVFAPGHSLQFSLNLNQNCQLDWNDCPPCERHCELNNIFIDWINRSECVEKSNQIESNSLNLRNSVRHELPLRWIEIRFAFILRRHTKEFHEKSVRLLQETGVDNRHGCANSEKWCDWFGALHYASTKRIFYLAIITILLASAKWWAPKRRKMASTHERQTTTNIISSSWILMSFR